MRRHDELRRPRRGSQRHRFVAVALGVALTVAACNDDGRTLAPAPDIPLSPATLPPPETTPPVEGANVPTDAGLVVSLRSPEIPPAQPIDVDLTCAGQDRSPVLFFSDIPAGAVELAVTMVAPIATQVTLPSGGIPSNPADEPLIGWVVAGIPADTARLDAGVLPEGAVVARNDAGVAGWTGPCADPTADPRVHELALHVLFEPLGLSPDLDGPDALALIEGAAVETATLSFTDAVPAG